VKLGYHYENPDQPVAIKSILKEKVKKKEVLQRELNTLKKLDHPNIIKFYETYDDGKYVHFVMEYCPGGDLFERVESPNEPMMTEDQVKKIMFKLVKTVNYMHSKKIIHRDLKLENVLLTGTSINSEIKLIDFGLSTFVNENEILNLHSKVGTPLYVAPEVHEGIYLFECDVWSLGVMLYFLLLTEPPFLATNLKDTYALAKAGVVDFSDELWTFYSPEVKDLISKMLRVERTQRITVEQTL
jgi:calcium-dependent protein kinase